MKKIAENVLKYADNALKVWEEENISLDDILDNRDLKKEQIRGIVSDLLFSYFRNKFIIDALIAKLTKKIQPPLKRIVSLGMTQLFFQSGIDTHSAVNVAVEYTKRKYNVKKGGFVNGVLRNSQRLDFQEFFNTQSEWIKLNMPKKLYNHWSVAYSKEQVAEFAKAFKEKPELTFRLRKPIADDELGKLASPMNNLPEWANSQKFYRCHDPKLLFEQDWLKTGKIYIQDPSTVHAPLMATGNFERILDVCAAPGGKSLILLETNPDALLVSNDRSFIRHKRTLENFAKSADKSQKNVFATIADAVKLPFKAQAFDYILLDVPCSNTGVIRHKADAIWRYNKKRIKELVELQKNILENTISYLKPGGTLVYSTCSIEPEENKIQIENFLVNHPEFKLVKQTQLLPTTLHDGAYAAALTKA